MRWLRPGAVAIAVVTLSMLPFALRGRPYLLHLVILCLLYVCFASAWNIVGGFIGQISFGHAAFVGIGAYTTALLWLRLDVHPIFTMPVAGLLAAAYGWLWGWPCLRLTGPYFAIATIGVGEATRLVMNNLEVTGGSSGLTLPTPESYSRLPDYYLVVCLAAITVGTSLWIAHSRFGLGLRAIRDDRDVAESLGVPTARYQLYALSISSFLAGMAGSFYAQYIFFVVPEEVFGFDLSISMILMALIGGLGTILGPVAGAVLFLLLEQLVLISFPNLHLGTFGLLLIAIVLFEPHGVGGVLRRVRDRVFRESARDAS